MAEKYLVSISNDIAGNFVKTIDLSGESGYENSAVNLTGRPTKFPYLGSLTTTTQMTMSPRKGNKRVVKFIDIAPKLDLGMEGFIEAHVLS